MNLDLGETIDIIMIAIMVTQGTIRKLLSVMAEDTITVPINAIAKWKRNISSTIKKWISVGKKVDITMISN